MGTFNSRSFAQRGFPTFAAAGTATGLTPNTIYHVGGKTTVGDTYAGLFTYVPDDSTAASDDVIVVTGGRLKRQSFDSIVQGSPQLIEGQVALPSDVVNAIGSAVNAAIRGGGALPVPAGPRPQLPPGTPVDFPVSVTLADATEREVVLFGTSVPRMVATTPGSGNTVRVRVRYEAGGDPDQPPEFAAITDASPYEVRRASLDAPVYSVLVARTAGAGSAKVVIS